MENPNLLSGEDVGMILLGKEIQILNLQKQTMALQQQIAELARVLEAQSKAGKVEEPKDPNEPIPFSGRPKKT